MSRSAAAAAGSNEIDQVPIVQGNIESNIEDVTMDCMRQREHITRKDFVRAELTLSHATANHSVASLRHIQSSFPKQCLRVKIKFLPSH